jgi:hypothetical protein
MLWWRQGYVHLQFLLRLSLACDKTVGVRTAKANVCSGAAGDKVIATTAEDAIVTAKSIDYVCTGTAQDQVIAFSPGD